MQYNPNECYVTANFVKQHSTHIEQQYRRGGPALTMPLVSWSCTNHVFNEREYIDRYGYYAIMSWILPIYCAI